jgi:hypothetical protein
VTEKVPLVQTESGSAGTTVGEQEFKNMPLNGRNTIELAFTVPGVLADPGVNSDEVGIYQNPVSPGSAVNIGGGRYGSSAVLADGVNATSVGIGRTSVSFSPDTIQEVRVIVSSFSAQYGSTGGGIISTVSRSGTNQLRGGVFWYNRNPKFQARTFNSLAPPTLRRNEPGMNLGGPVLLPKIYDGRNRTFFFFSFEPKRWKDGVAASMRLPTAKERQGDFRNTWGTILPTYQQVDVQSQPVGLQATDAALSRVQHHPVSDVQRGQPGAGGQGDPQGVS